MNEFIWALVLTASSVTYGYCKVIKPTVLLHALLVREGTIKSASVRNCGEAE